MITRKVVVQLCIFALIALVGTGYLGARYAGLDRLFGAGGYRVDVELADSGGIFPNAEVTYRGVAIGTVNGLRLTPGGVTAELFIRNDAPPVPADARAVVANRSAIGEQTVDLRPEHAGGPYLADGAVIPASRTALPPAPELVLANADTLVRSVNTDALRTLVTELGAGFTGTGDSIGRLIDGGDAVTRTANQYLPQFVSLLHNSQVVLRTQQAAGRDIRDYSRGLRQVAAELKKADPDLRTVIDDLPETTEQVDWLVDHVGSPLSDVLEDLVPVTRILEERGAAVKQLLVAYPMVLAMSATLPDKKTGRGRLAFVLPFYDPPPCTKGYLPLDQQRGADDLTPNTHDFSKIGCQEPKGSPIGVRGSQHAPKPSR